MRISRRTFCGYTLASGLASALPSHVLLAQDARSPNDIPQRVPAFTLSGEETGIERAAIRELAESLQGGLMLRGDFGYDGARRLWNGMHDRYPALIVRATNRQDVANAVTFARERELLLAVKGGGHSWPGRSVADGALMIDLGAMNDVLVDAERRRARAGGGALLYNLDVETQKHGLATTAGVVSHTGLGGLTLGGGYGILNRKFGLTIDNLLSATIVTADGRIRRASADENEDLFWAIRGGGGNFGVVTEFEYQLHEAGPMMLGGGIAWPLSQARQLLEFYAEYSQRLSDDLYTGPQLAVLPDGTGIVNVAVCYCGSDFRAAERELAPLRRFGQPLNDAIQPTSYIAMQTARDGTFRPGIRSYAKSAMVGEFTEGLINAMVESFDPAAGPTIGTHTAGGAVARIGETETAWPHRNAESVLVFGAVWDDPAEDERLIARTRALYDAVEPYTGGYYDNIDSDQEDISDNYSPVYDRLVSVKNDYDPMNLFRLNSNIPPTA